MKLFAEFQNFSIFCRAKLSFPIDRTTYYFFHAKQITMIIRTRLSVRVMS